jgi:hypothetical protein
MQQQFILQLLQQLRETVLLSSLFKSASQNIDLSNSQWSLVMNLDQKFGAYLYIIMLPVDRYYFCDGSGMDKYQFQTRRMHL